MPLLTRPLRLLTADGALVRLDAREAALGRPTVLIARELCRYERFTAPVGVAGRAALAAARLHARARSPFAEPGLTLVRRDRRFDLWWWDAAAAARSLGAAGEGARLLPEPLLEPPGDGARIVRARGGQEAQRWADGLLAARRWSGRPFDAATWAAFARVAGLDAATPPPAQPLPLAARSAYARRRVRDLDLAGAAPGWATAFATLTLGLAAFFAGQGGFAAYQDAAVRKAIAVREAQGVRSRRPQLAAQARRLAAVSRLVDRPDPLSRVLAAQRVLDRFGVRIGGFEAGPHELTVTAPATAVAGVDILVEALEASPEFRDVRPALDRQARRLTLKMAYRGPDAG